MRGMLACGLLWLAACAPEPAPVPRGDGELVLELGGAHPSLAASLQHLGVELQQRRDWRPAPAPATRAPADAGGTASPRDATSPRDTTEPPPAADAKGNANAGTEPQTPANPAPRVDPAAPADPAAAAAAEWLVVELAPRQTLMDVARIHLGTARRFKEIMAWNGWSDRDARRLREGTKVKIRRDAMPR